MEHTVGVEPTYKRFAGAGIGRHARCALVGMTGIEPALYLAPNQAGVQYPTFRWSGWLELNQRSLESESSGFPLSHILIVPLCYRYTTSPFRDTLGIEPSLEGLLRRMALVETRGIEPR